MELTDRVKITLSLTLHSSVNESGEVEEEVVDPTIDPDDTEEEEQTECDTWCVGATLLEGTIICYEDLQYRVMQTTVASELYPPDAEGVLALYMRWRGSDLYEWLYGEYVEQGWCREYNGVIYQCITAYAGANITTPDVATSVWVETC